MSLYKEQENNGGPTIIEKSPVPPPGARVDIVGAIGLAEKILIQPDSLKNRNFWMGITTSKKTYPDEMVVDYAKWVEEHCRHFMVVVADGMQVQNQLAIKGLTPIQAIFGEPKGAKWFLDEIEDYRRSARKRQAELKQKLHDEGLVNTRVRLWSELSKMLGRNELDRFTTDAFYEIAELAPVVDPEFNSRVNEIAGERAAHVLSRSRDPERSRSIAGLYIKTQWALTMALSSLGNYDYLIKVGPEAERIYDELVLDSHKYGIGTLRGKEANSFIPFGAIYLRHSAIIPPVLTDSPIVDQ